MAIFRYVEDSWVVDNDGETVATIPDGPQQGAKGRRCAAALNETWGISTEDLEAGAVAGLVEAAKAMRDYHLHDLTDYQDDPLPKLERALAVIDLDEALAALDHD